MKMTKRELAKQIGVAKGTIDVWLRAGLPKEKEKRDGKITALFSVANVAEWMVHNGKDKYVFKLGELLPPVDDDAIPEPLDESMAAEEALLAQVRVNRQQAWEALQHSQEHAKPFMRELFQKAAAIEEKVEHRWTATQLALGSVISRDDSERELYEMAATISSALDNLAQILSGLCVDLPDQMTAYNIIVSEVRRCKSGLANGGEQHDDAD